ncbi:hypothetical protein [uncultured Helicobacter sp.]|uniref:hypothetical protein n=1 Tax=uncultured Helicobacter sp. TaxID=175537 RepID=UPI0037520A4C
MAGLGAVITYEVTPTPAPAKNSTSTTAMTNFLKKLCFVVCSSNPTQSTPRQEGKPSAECRVNSESNSIDSKDSQKQNFRNQLTRFRI